MRTGESEPYGLIILDRLNFSKKTKKAKINFDFLQLKHFLLFLTGNLEKAIFKLTPNRNKRFFRTYGPASLKS